MMKIDIFNHLFPKNFFDKMIEVAPNQKDIGKRVRSVPVIVDLEKRFRVMDQFEDYVQVICLPIGSLDGPDFRESITAIDLIGECRVVECQSKV